MKSYGEERRGSRMEYNNYTYLKPIDNESLWYRDIFEKYYPRNEKIVPYFWLPKWTDELNPSGRLIL